MEIHRQPARGEIRADITGRLDSDIWVDDDLIVAHVSDGEVKLTGSVGSAIENTYASSDAWVAGVKNVDASGLTVNPWLRDENRRRTKTVPDRSDSEISKAVKMAFLYDPRVFSFNPTIEVKNGTVTLTGVVDNLKAKDAAARDARNTVGVKSVLNLLRVRQPNPPSDAEIAKDIREALDASPFVDRFDIVVRVMNRKAYLSGLADSPFEKSEAGRIAAGGTNHECNCRPSEPRLPNDNPNAGQKFFVNIEGQEYP